MGAGVNLEDLTITANTQLPLGYEWNTPPNGQVAQFLGWLDKRTPPLEDPLFLERTVEV